MSITIILPGHTKAFTSMGWEKTGLCLYDCWHLCTYFEVLRCSSREALEYAESLTSKRVNKNPYNVGQGNGLIPFLAQGIYDATHEVVVLCHTPVRFYPNELLAEKFLSSDVAIGIGKNDSNSADANRKLGRSPNSAVPTALSTSCIITTKYWNNKVGGLEKFPSIKAYAKALAKAGGAKMFPSWTHRPV